MFEELGPTGLVVVMALVIVEMSKLVISKVARRNGKGDNPGYGNPIRGLRSDERDILIRLDDVRRAYWDDHRGINLSLDRLASGQQSVIECLQRIESKLNRFSKPPKPAG